MVSQETLTKTPFKLSKLALIGADVKKTAYVLSLVLTVSLILGVQFVKLVEANPMPTDPVISIETPIDKTYDVNSLVLTITIVTKYDGYYFTSARRIVSYSLDGNTKVTIVEIDYTYDEEEKASTFNGSAVLSELADGSHSLIVYAKYDYDVKMIQSQSSINFTVDTRANSFPTSLIIASSVTVAVFLIGSGLLLYGIKRK